MNPVAPKIDSWHATQTGPTTAEVVLIGGDFGTTRGLVTLQVQGVGSVNATVLYWNATTIIVAAPVDKVVNRVIVDIPSGQRGPRVRAFSPPSQSWSTVVGTPSFAVSDVTTNNNLITMTGTTLDVVDQVVLLKQESGQGLTVPAVIVSQSATSIVVLWPLEFPSNVGTIRLVDYDAQYVLSVTKTGGYTPDAGTPIVDGVTVDRLATGDAVLNIFGRNFGTSIGLVSVVNQSGVLPQSVLMNGWSNTLIRSNAPEGATITDLFVRDANNVLATLAAGVVPFNTPSGNPHITGAFSPLTGIVRVVGVDLLEVGTLSFIGNDGLNLINTSAQNPDIVTSAADNNLAYGVEIAEWTNTQIEIHSQRFAGNTIVTNIALIDEIGGPLDAMPIALTIPPLPETVASMAWTNDTLNIVGTNLDRAEQLRIVFTNGSSIQFTLAGDARTLAHTPTLISFDVSSAAGKTITAISLKVIEPVGPWYPEFNVNCPLNFFA